MNKTVAGCGIGVVVATGALCAIVGVWAGLMVLVMAVCCAGLVLEIMLYILDGCLVGVKKKIKADIKAEMRRMKESAYDLHVATDEFRIVRNTSLSSCTVERKFARSGRCQWIRQCGCDFECLSDAMDELAQQDGYNSSIPFDVIDVE